MSVTGDSPEHQRILVTGGSGLIGGMLRPRLRRAGRTLRLLDVVDPDLALDEDEEFIRGSILDAADLARAVDGCDAVVHLGGIGAEAPWEEILEVNVTGTKLVLDAARDAGVSRVVLASSNHVVGFRAIDEGGSAGIPADAAPRPDTFYGVGKAAMEALGSLYHSRYGMDVVAIRIGACVDEPTGPGLRELRMWLSPDDAGRLFEAALSAPSPGYAVVWGMSANTRGVTSLREARLLGYAPADDAERFADRLGDAALPTDGFIGGGFCVAPLGGR